jgi:HD-like signal output (HDOD) protein
LNELHPIEIDPNTFLRDHCSLPPLPKLISQIQQIMNSEEMNIVKVAELIKGDPALVAQILKVVNSAYYSLPKDIADIKFAIAYLGLNDVYRIVLSIAAVNTLNIKAENELNEFWAHSYFSALCAKYFSKKYHPHFAQDELWSAAILHDIGKLIYLKFFPEHYRQLKKYSRDNGCLFSEAETHYSVHSSAYLGSLLCEHWRLAPKIRDACSSHGLDDLRSINNDKTSKRFIHMICLANFVAVLAFDNLNTALKEELSEAIMTSLNCSEEEFLVIMGDIYDLKIEVERFA